MRNTGRSLRYVRAWLTGNTRAREQRIRVTREDRDVPALLLLPPGDGPHPAWIALHGVTRPGIDHPALLRFAHAVASSGAAVLVPEVPEWKDLRLAPDATLPTVRAAVCTLLGLRNLRPPFGLIGFSFGGPQVLIVSSHESVAEHLAGVVSFGAYCDLKRLVHFYLTGEHEWQGREWRSWPDPYGRWLMGANYLTIAAGYGDSGDVAQALWELAAITGDLRGPPADSPVYHELQERLRSRLRPAQREIFNLFVHPPRGAPPREACVAMGEALAAGSLSVSPLMEPVPFLGRLEKPVELLHGHGDRLIPYTESLRLEEKLPERTNARLTITRLFAHAKGDRFPLLKGPSESWTFLRALGRVLGTVR